VHAAGWHDRNCGVAAAADILNIKYTPGGIDNDKISCYPHRQFFAPIFWLLFFNLVFHPYGHYREQQSCRA
jgi:hypothetical protein